MYNYYKTVASSPVLYNMSLEGFPGGSVRKNSPAVQETRRCGFKPWVGKISWRSTSNPLQYSCLENPIDRGAGQVAVHTVTKIGHS